MVGTYDVDSNSSASTPERSKLKNVKWIKDHGIFAPFTYPEAAAQGMPLIIEKSEGCYVYDSNGNKYLDAVAGMFCTALGGNEPRLVAAANSQLNSLPYYNSFGNCANRPSLDLANELLNLFTARKMAKVFFSSSGSDANDTQVKLVWYYNNALGRPKKKKIISRSGSYHGSTMISASLTRFPLLHEGFDLPAPFVLETADVHYWRYHLPGETEEQFTNRLVEELENLILKEGPETVAAFIVEPVTGVGGAIIPPKNYFEKVQAVLKKYDILLIADEVVCGFGRLGTMFGCDKFNIKPDLVTLAKGLASAYMPIAAVLISPEIADVIFSFAAKLGVFSHGFTFSAHPVACAVALEAVKIYKERKIDQQVQKISPRLLDGLKTFSNSPISGEIRGMGLFAAFELTDNKSPNDMFPPEWAIGSFFQEQCMMRGLIVRAIKDKIVLAPPLIITPEEIDEMVRILGEALKLTEDRVKELKLLQQQQSQIKNLTFNGDGCLQVT